MMKKLLALLLAISSGLLLGSGITMGEYEATNEEYKILRTVRDKIDGLVEKSDNMSYQDVANLLQKRNGKELSERSTFFITDLSVYYTNRSDSRYVEINDILQNKYQKELSWMSLNVGTEPDLCFGLDKTRCDQNKNYFDGEACNELGGEGQCIGDGSMEKKCWMACDFTEYRLN